MKKYAKSIQTHQRRFFMLLSPLCNLQFIVPFIFITPPRNTERVRDHPEAPISTALPFRHPLCNSVHHVSCRTARCLSLSLSTVRSACIILGVENNGRAFNDSAQDGSVYPPFSAHLNVQSILLRVFRASSKWLTRKIALFLVHQLSVVFALRSFCMFTATKFAFLFFRH